MQDTLDPRAGRWPLVGRDRELGRLREALAGRRPQGTFIAGAPGTGKTRLGEEALALAREAGLATTTIAATTSAARIPFGAFATLLPRRSEDAVTGEGATDLLRRVASTVAERAGEGRLALLVDDAHLLDDASAAFTHQLATERRTFLIVTVRVDQAAPDAVIALWKDGLAERLDVPPLASEQVGHLLERVLGGPVEGLTVRRFAEHCEGSPLLLRELVCCTRRRQPLPGAGRMAPDGQHGCVRADDESLRREDARPGGRGAGDPGAPGPGRTARPAVTTPGGTAGTARGPGAAWPGPGCPGRQAARGPAGPSPRRPDPACRHPGPARCAHATIPGGGHRAGRTPPRRGRAQGEPVAPGGRAPARPRSPHGGRRGGEPD